MTLGVLIGLGVLGAVLRGDGPLGDHIAHVEIYGTIFDDPARADMLRALAEDETAKALIVEISSPGGTTVGAEALYENLRDIGKDRPVVAVMREVAASGGYITAIAADHIVARGNTLTGSIGVIMEYPDVTELMDRIGVEMRTVRSSELKAEPSPFRAPSPGALAVQRALIDDSQAWFRGLVAERRGLDGEALERVTQGTVFTGRLALDAGLIDALGAQDEALNWLESVDETLTGLEVFTWEPVQPEPSFLQYITGNSLFSGFFTKTPRPTDPRLMSILK
ncbi:MAG: signal peptide peptidase SppA [Pseudomonadota bacterium]